MSSSTVGAKRQINLWWIALVCGMASFIDAMAVAGSSAALVIYQNDLGLTNVQYGVINAALQITIAVGAVLGGRLGDRFGRKPVFSVTMLFIIVGMLLLVFGTSYPILVLGMAIAGLGAGGDLPVSLASISEAASDKNRGKLLSVSQLLWIVGLMGGQLAGAAFGNMAGRAGGQIIFGIICGVGVLTFIARSTIPESTAWREAHDRAASNGDNSASTASLSTLLSPQYRRPFIALLGFYTLVNIGFYCIGAFTTWINVNLIHMTVSLSAGLQAVFFFIGVIANLCFMQLADTRWRMPIFAIGGVLLIVTYLAFPVLGFSVLSFVIFMVLANIATNWAGEAMMKVWTQESFPTMLRSSAQGIILFVARMVVSVVAVYAVSVIAWNPSGAFIGLAVISALGLAAAFWGFGGSRASKQPVEKDRAA